MKKFIIILIIIVALALSIKPFLYWQNNTVGVTNYTISSEKIPTAFDGYKILQISDMQGEEFGEGNASLISLIEKQQADMVVFTGDFVDGGVDNIEVVIDNLLKNVKLPKEVYAISGNHDKWVSEFGKYKKLWETTYDIKFLEDKSTRIIKDNQSINLYGIADPSEWVDEKANRIVKDSTNKLHINEGYNILLFHRANMLDMFKDSQFDLIFSGHMHGGQIRIPYVCGLKSPHGDWFPKYSGGKYKFNDKTFIVNRGIANAVPVPRVFNRAEIVVVTLKTK